MSVGYLSQHAEELADHGTVLDAAQRATDSRRARRARCSGASCSPGEEAQKPLAGLSGGELRRLSLAILVHSGANVLVLDEPTNHLDLESREALEDALTSFAGSLLLVSHDRALLDAVGTRTVAIEDGRLHNYEGGWAEYVQARDARREAAEPCPVMARKSNVSPKAVAKEGGPSKGPSKNAQRAQRELEREIEAAEAALLALEDELADPSAWADQDRAAASSERHAAAKRQWKSSTRAGRQPLGSGADVGSGLGRIQLEPIPVERDGYPPRRRPCA